jgi:hypothetical protein
VIFFIVVRNGGVGGRRKMRVGDVVVDTAESAVGMDGAVVVEVGADAGT